MSPNPMPVLFLGHGSPMNAIETNEFTQVLSELGSRLPRPKAILCVSAHWMTEGTWITHQERPRTIHDFHGFPKALFEARYPAPGDPALADAIRAAVPHPIQADGELWGYDHGAWSVLKHLYPKADVPTLQLSLYMARPAAYHFELGRALRVLREQGILIVGSGNLVHNLRKIVWDTHAEPYDWAVECDAWMKEKLEKRDFKALVEEPTASPAGRLSIPTWDHYYPFLYSIGAAHENESLKFEFEGIHNASISMRCVSFGLFP